MRVLNRIPASRRTLISLGSPAAIVATCALLAACGSSGSGSGSGSSPSTTKTTSQTVASSAKASVETTKVSGYGTVLATGSDTPLYLFTGDPTGGSKCTGTCAKQWPPLTVSGKPSAGTGVNSALLSSFKRSDGTYQVLYDGHALYTHPGLGASAVAGTAANGGVWYLVAPSGKPIKTTTGGGY